MTIRNKLNEFYGSDDIEKDLTYSGHYFIVIRRCDRSSIKTLFSLIGKDNQKVRQGKRKFDLPKPRLTRPELLKSIKSGYCYICKTLVKELIWYKCDDNAIKKPLCYSCYEDLVFK